MGRIVGAISLEIAMLLLRAAAFACGIFVVTLAAVAGS